jgi:hypothetical protein
LKSLAIEVRHITTRKKSKASIVHPRNPAKTAPKLSAAECCETGAGLDPDMSRIIASALSAVEKTPFIPGNPCYRFGGCFRRFRAQLSALPGAALNIHKARVHFADD